MKRQRADIADFLAVAHVLADQSAAAILPHFRRAIKVDNKATGGGFDPVTAADRAAERIIRKTIRQQLPEHGVDGEEFEPIIGAGRFRWVIDPIDGTRAFILGMPIWGTLIGLMDGERPILGMMDQPYTRERFWAAGKTARFRDASGRQRRLKTRPCPALGDAMLTTTHPDMFKPGFEHDRFFGLKAKVKSARYGGDCYTYCLLAAGMVDVIVEAGLKPFDIMPLVPIIETAGGIVTTWDGKSATSGGRIVASGDPRLHDKVLSTLR